MTEFIFLKNCFKRTLEAANKETGTMKCISEQTEEHREGNDGEISPKAYYNHIICLTSLKSQTRFSSLYNPLAQ